MSALNDDMIAQLLKEDAEAAANPTTRGPHGPKIDLTTIREIPVWMKLNHHLCTPDCEHRAQHTGDRACWNPNCMDTRNPDDRGTNIVVLVKEQWICRYCFLGDYLK